ncbi:MAG: phosphoglycerate mutase family protein [Solirubrobacterales bacterium]|nr:phosphoglycerate mutase family protein [Solirubrobacterales bacterium]
MPELWLIRHAPAAGNLGGTFMGQLDAEPDAEGLARAAALAGSVDADLVLSSPLRRAALTAVAIFPAHAITYDPRLMERHLGAWQGRDKRAVQGEQPAAFTDAGTLDLRVSPPGGESFAALRARVGAVLAEVAAQPDGTTVALVAHNGVMRTARVLLGLLVVASASRTPERFAEPDRVSVAPGSLARSARTS